MNVVLHVVIAILAAAGLLALSWLLLGRILAPVGGRGGGRVVAVLPASGGGETLEHDVTGLLWLRGGGMARFSIVIADQGLDEQGRALAEILAQRDPGVALCRPDALGDYLREE